MAVTFNITEMFNEYVKSDVIYNIENIWDNNFLENLLKTDAIIEKITKHLNEDEKFLKLLREKTPSMEEGDEEDTIRELLLNEEEWVTEYLYENWDGFLKNADIDELAESYLNHDPDYGYFFWDSFVESEFQFETKPFFFDKELLTEIIPVDFNDKEDISIRGLLTYLEETDEEISKFLKDLNEYDAPDVFGELSVKVYFSVDSRYYDEELTIECLPNYYAGYDYEDYTDAEDFAKEAFGDEEDWETMIEEGGYSEEEIKEKLEYVFERVKEFAESIESVYADIINGDYYNSQKYEKERFFKRIMENLHGPSLKIIKDDVKTAFLKEIDKPYNDLKTFLSGYYYKLHNKFKILRKYRNLFKENELKNLDYLTDKFISDYDYMKLPEYKDGTYESWGGLKTLLIEEDNYSNIFGIKYFEEDSQNLFKSFKNRIDKYENAYEEFLEIIKDDKIPKLISLLNRFKNGNEIKEVIAYINYRLFEDYKNNDKENNFFLRHKDTIIEGAYTLAPLYPSEFAVFLITESYGKKDRNKTYRTYYNDETKNSLKKEILKEFKKIADKSSVKKLINKAFALYPYDECKDGENKESVKRKYKGISYLENEFIRPLSLCENPLKEKADLYTAREFLSLKLKEMEKKREKSGKEIKTGDPDK